AVGVVSAETDEPEHGDRHDSDPRNPAEEIGRIDDGLHRKDRSDESGADGNRHGPALPRRGRSAVAVGLWPEPVTMLSAHPTLPSSELPIIFCVSAMNSIGSCCSTSRTKPLTISAVASSALMPRCW